MADLVHLAGLIELAERSELIRGRLLLIHRIHLINWADLVDLLHGRAVVHAPLDRRCCNVRDLVLTTLRAGFLVSLRLAMISSAPSGPTRRAPSPSTRDRR